jgi:hypothetical protein
MMRAILVVAVLAACGRSTPITDEMRERDEYVRDLAWREGLLDVWSLMPRSTITFEDGLSPIVMIDPQNPTVAWHQTSRATASGLGMPIRWLGPRAHLRVRGETDMRLEMTGRADLVQLYTRPLVTASFDGVEFHSGLPDAEGYFTITATIPRGKLADWSDIYLTFSSVHEPWRDLTTLHVIRLERVSWEPVTPPGPDG